MCVQSELKNYKRSFLCNEAFFEIPSNFTYRIFAKNRNRLWQPAVKDKCYAFRKKNVKNM